MMDQSGRLAGKVCGVYRLTFSNGHYYIGQSIHIRRRYSQHIRDLKFDRHTNERLVNCYKKHGKPVVEVIEECNECDLDMVETKHITIHIDNPLCCNMCRDGRSRLGTTVSDATKQKISDYQHMVGKTKPVDMFTDAFQYLGTFQSIRDGEAYIGASPKDVQKSCKSNGYYRVKGHRFMFSNIRMTLTNAVTALVPI